MKKYMLMVIFALFFMCQSCSYESSADKGTARQRGAQNNEASLSASISGELDVTADYGSARAIAHLVRGPFDKDSGIIMEAPNWGEFLNQRMKLIFLNVMAVNDPARRHPRLSAEVTKPDHSRPFSFKFFVDSKIISRTMEVAQPLEFQTQPNGDPQPDFSCKGVVMKTEGNSNLPSEKVTIYAYNFHGLQTGEDYNYKWTGTTEADGSLLIPLAQAKRLGEGLIMINMERSRLYETIESDGTKWIYRSRYVAKSAGVNFEKVRQLSCPN